jgi:hypothetical protein
MGHPVTSLYVGPYAEWLVPLERSFGPPPTSPRSPKVVLSEEEKSWDRLLDGGLLGWPFNEGEDLPQVEVQGRRFVRICAVPLQTRAGQPDRPLFLAGGTLGPPGGWDPRQMVNDLTTLDREVEIEWFRTAFAAELAEVVRLSGLEPSICWGLIYWRS